MIILAPIVSVLTILVYFMLSIIMPILSYLVPYYKIKKVNIFGNRYKLIVNIAVALILYMINVKILLIYLVYPFFTEFLFYFTQRFAHKIKTFDRIVIMSLISTVVIFTIIYYNRLYIENIIESILNSNSERLINIDKREIQNSFLYLKENTLSAVFSYLFIGNIFLFFTLSAPNAYERWKISCYWLIPFMAIVLLNKYGITLNTFLKENILTLIKYIYVWYGIKTLYNLAGKIGVKFNMLRHLISIILGVVYPLPVFILGALASFEVIETKIIKI